jgi:hypothetical protein
MRARPDRKLLSQISRQYRGLECGKLIAIAHKYKRQQNYLEATRAYAAARNTLAFQSAGWQCVEAWRAATAAQALRDYPALGLQLLDPFFYQRFAIPRIRIPLPLGEAHDADGGWSDERVLECLRYFLLDHEYMAEDYERLISRLACKIGAWEGRHGDVDRAEFYFGLARQYGGQHWETLSEVGHGYLAAQDYDGALRELLLLRKWQLRAKVFDAGTWLEICNLHFYLGHSAAGTRMVRDYLRQCSCLPLPDQRRLLRFAYSWAINHHPEPALVSALDRLTLKQSGGARLAG